MNTVYNEYSREVIVNVCLFCYHLHRVAVRAVSVAGVRRAGMRSLQQRASGKREDIVKYLYSQANHYLYRLLTSGCHAHRVEYWTLYKIR